MGICGSKDSTVVKEHSGQPNSKVKPSGSKGGPTKETHPGPEVVAGDNSLNNNNTTNTTTNNNTNKNTNTTNNNTHDITTDNTSTNYTASEKLSKEIDRNSTKGKNNNNNNGGGAISIVKPKKHAKILLLGSGESGKSTILRQIKIIHQHGFSENERLEYKPFVFQNVVESAQCLVKALNQYNISSEVTNLSSEELEFLLNYQVPLDEGNFNLPFDSKVSNLIEQLITDETVKNLLNNSKYDFYILDSASYFFENLNRIKESDYLPTVTDILRTRKQTSGIFDTKFQMEDLDVHLFDVGGQRSERKKWIHCFDNVTAIIFCVSLSEYDQTLLESPNKNRLEESLNLFESVVNSMWFKKTAVILCLNKIDIFIDKLANSPLENYFPDYVGGDNVNKAVKYILWRFKQLNRANLNMVPYVSQATDTNNIRLAFAVVRETILHNNLVESGILND